MPLIPRRMQGANTTKLLEIRNGHESHMQVRILVNQLHGTELSLLLSPGCVRKRKKEFAWMSSAWVELGLMGHSNWHLELWKVCIFACMSGIMAHGPLDRSRDRWYKVMAYCKRDSLNRTLGTRYDIPISPTQSKRFVIKSHEEEIRTKPKTHYPCHAIEALGQWFWQCS